MFCCFFFSELEDDCVCRPQGGYHFQAGRKGKGTHKDPCFIKGGYAAPAGRMQYFHVVVAHLPTYVE